MFSLLYCSMQFQGDAAVPQHNLCYVEGFIVKSKLLSSIVKAGYPGLTFKNFKFGTLTFLKSTYNNLTSSHPLDHKQIQLYIGHNKRKIF